MAAAPLVPDGRSVYRGLSNRNWSKNGVVGYKAFMLRPATAEFPPEEEISLGLSPDSAVEELKEHHGVAELGVRAVHDLPRGLSVRIDVENDTKARLWGLPLFSTEEAQRDLALAVATDLARISVFLPGPPSQ